MRESLVFRGGPSDKFWRIRVEGRRAIVVFGRTGTTGQTQGKSYASEAAAVAAAEGQARAKLRKGYVRDGGGDHEDTSNGASKSRALAHRILKTRVKGVVARSPRKDSYKDNRWRLCVAWACVAIGDAATAATLTEPVLEVTGSDPAFGDTLDWLARIAAALLLHLARERGDSTAVAAMRRRFDASSKILLKDFKPTVVERGVSRASARKDFASLGQQDVDMALYSVDGALGAIAESLVREPGDTALLSLLAEGLEAVRARLSPGTTKPASDRVLRPPENILTHAALARTSQAEKNVVLAERLDALAWRVRETGHDHDLANSVAAAYLALGRADDARALLTAVVHALRSKKGGASKTLTHALAMLLRLDEEPAVRKAFEDTYWYRDVCFKRPGDYWRETLPDELSKKNIAELQGERLHSAIARLGTDIGVFATCIAARPKNVDLAPVERHLERVLLPMLRERLTSKRDTALATALSRLERQPPAIRPLPSVLDPKKERHAALRRLKDRVAKRPSLRSASVVLDALTIAVCAWARDGDAASLAVLTSFVAVPYVGDKDVWYEQGMAVALHAALGGRPSYTPRLDADPLSSLDAEWLAERADDVRRAADDPAALKAETPTDRTLCRLAHLVGWIVVARSTDVFGERLPHAVVDSAWKNAKTAIRGMLAAR
jgi:predicted DNA-binding WGR domain protein